MILFLVIVVILLALGVVSIGALLTGGSVILLLLGDLAVCVFIIWLIVRHFRNKGES